MGGARPPGASVLGSAALAMPKMKTNRAAAKRFRFTGSGRVRRTKSGLNHMMQEKSRKRLRRLRKNDIVDSALEKRVKLLLPYG
jgi:large subunit ribosomal protein L35